MRKCSHFIHITMIVLYHLATEKQTEWGIQIAVCAVSLLPS